jgi:hypothetical protein
MKIVGLNKNLGIHILQQLAEVGENVHLLLLENDIFEFLYYR